MQKPEQELTYQQPGQQHQQQPPQKIHGALETIQESPSESVPESSPSPAKPILPVRHEHLLTPMPLHPTAPSMSIPHPSQHRPDDDDDVDDFTTESQIAYKNKKDAAKRKTMGKM